MAKVKVRYLIAVFLMLFFVLNDLAFDFLFNFQGSDYISFACTLIAAIIVFYCNYSIKKNHITTEFESASEFIKSNFDNWQVVFSILDIICGVVSILSGLALLAAIFKVVKIGYVPVKITVVTNKGKSIVKAVSKVSLLWTSGRLLSEDGKENKDKENIKMAEEKKKGFWSKVGGFFKTVGQWIYANKLSIIETIASIAAGVTTAIAANADLIVWLPQWIVFGFNIMPYLAGLVIFGLAEVGVQFESIRKFFDRIAVKKAEKELANSEKVAAKEKSALDKEAAKYLKEQQAKEKAEAKKAALEQAKKDAEAKKAKAEEEKKAAEEAAAKAKADEEARIIARAMELKAEAEAKAKQQ